MKLVSKTSKSLTILFLAFILIFGKQNIASAGQFSQTCTNLDMDGTFLVADCRNINGGFVQTEIDLNNFIQNSNGNLAWDSNGGRYIETCQGCHLDIEGSQFPGAVFLVCGTCQRGDGSWNNGNPDISLNAKISNIDGELEIDDDVVHDEL